MASKYEPKNIPAKSVQVINTLRSNISTSSEAALQELQYLEDTLKKYKEAITLSIDLNLEKNDLVAKYSKAKTGGSYNLPGIMASTTANYDLASMKTDNQRLSVIKEESERAQDEAELYYKMIIENYKGLVRRFKTISKSNVGLSAFFENLATYSDWTSGNS